MDITKGVSSLEFQVPSKGGAVFPLFRRRRTKGWGPDFSFSLRTKGQKNKRGLWVVFLGPDGAGKSSVIAGLGSGASAGFTGCEAHHLRPTLVRPKQIQAPNCDPHGQQARGMLITACKLMYLLAANWLGYLAVVRPRVSRGTLVLFDRYFLDCVIDAKRYRLPRSCRRLAEMVARLVPQPDLWVVLDAPASTLQQRKREVTPAESEEQRREYAHWAARLPNAEVVNADRPLSGVVDAALECIIERHLATQRPGYQVA